MLRCLCSDVHQYRSTNRVITIFSLDIITPVSINKNKSALALKDPDKNRASERSLGMGKDIGGEKKSKVICTKAMHRRPWR
jgi:hypothetical protein